MQCSSLLTRQVEEGVTLHIQNGKAIMPKVEHFLIKKKGVMVMVVKEEEQVLPSSRSEEVVLL